MERARKDFGYRPRFCEVSTTGNAISLEAVMASVDGLSESTVMVIEAWAGNGGEGATSNGGRGGRGGYAQTITTIGHFIKPDGTGTKDLYCYLGKEGEYGTTSDGSQVVAGAGSHHFDRRLLSSRLGTPS